MFESFFTDICAVESVGERDFFNAFVSIGDSFGNAFSESGNAENTSAVADDIAVFVKFGPCVENDCTCICGFFQTLNHIAFAV